MEREKNKRYMKLAFVLGALVVLGFDKDIYHLETYWVSASFVFILFARRTIWHKEFEERFYSRWQRAMKHGMILNVAIEGLKGIILIFVVTAISQYFWNDRNVFNLIVNLQTMLFFRISLIMLLFGIAYGFAAWYEKNRRYERICYEKNR